MKNRKLLIWFFVASLSLLILIVLTFNFYKSDIPLINNFLKNNKLACIPPGEVAQNASLGPDGHFGECCKGLSLISSRDCSSEFILGSGMICSDCGNGICESWENKCNCKEDCK